MNKCFADYSDITSDDSRTKDINGYWEKEVAELLGDLMPPMEVRNKPRYYYQTRCSFKCTIMLGWMGLDIFGWGEV